MQVWAVNENNSNLRLSNEQWSVLMEEINKLNPNLKFKKNIFNSTLEDSYDQYRFWLECRNFNSTVILFKTNFSKIVGLYSPDKWVKTEPGEAKNITNSKTLQFYIADGDVKIVKDNYETKD